MADEGTFIGEVQRGWQRFSRLSWWWKGPILGGVGFVALIIALAAAGGGSDKKSDSEVQATTTAAPPAETTSPSPETIPPTAAPEPTTEAPDIAKQIQGSYNDNRDFMIRASDDELKVEWLPDQGLVKIQIHPETVLTEGDSLTIAAHSSLVASRAIWTTYPDVQQIELTMLGDFTDPLGATTTELTAQITVLRALGEQFQYDGLRDLIYADNKHLFCVADHYELHLAIYRALEDKGCLAEWGFRK